jgi:hypothetical protein
LIQRLNYVELCGLKNELRNFILYEYKSVILN